MDGLRVVLQKLDPKTLLPKPLRTCNFCSQPESDELLYGKLHHIDKLNVHYYCLLFACNLQQKGSDSEGILGFLAPDIRNELERAQSEICSYCLKPGATVICVQRCCKKIFHLPCGIKGGSMHHFFGHFQSFCKTHRPNQKVPQTQLMIPEAPQCAICLEIVKRDPKCRTVVWAPCCKVNAWLHRVCVQKLAMSSGYFFKCPRCNNKNTFISAMQKCGIYIPEKDASWELEPNAFEELLHRHDLCDAENCICPMGREHDKDDTEWEIVLCNLCGSQGIHLGCLGYRNSRRKWNCPVCLTATQPKGSVGSPSASASSSSASSTSGAVGTELKRTAQWVDSSHNSSKRSHQDDQPWQPGEGEDKIAAASMSVSSGEEEEVEEDEGSDIEVEVVDVEEEQKHPGSLTTVDGVMIPVVTFDHPICDDDIQVKGDLRWRINAVDEICISDDSGDGEKNQSTNEATVISLD